MGIKIKPLEWRDNGGGKCAETPFGPYDYSKYGSRWGVYGQGTLIAEPEDEAGCISAAEADFAARVIACFVKDEPNF